MSKFAYKTIGNVSPQGKPHVYFACHPDDLHAFLEEYALKICHIQDCAIWYETEYEADYDREELEAQLAEMQLIVMPVTTKLLTAPNRAMDVEFEIAQTRHIPVLPVMMERGLDDVFEKRFGSLQYIDPNDQDPTRRSFDEVLETYIKAVLVGDELAKRVREAFDAYIFLSYRKKDRAKAQKLMRLIHKNPMYQDIAIWYDEFLTPGEDFNDLIGTMLKSSDLFALAVTPNLINEINYVMTVEYPEAVKNGKTILPVEMEPTDGKELKEKYEGIPDCVESEDEEVLLAALREHLHTVAIAENDNDPEHSFLIGLAYLDGIDVEVDFEKAVRLIMYAADAGVPEAMEQLVTMYETGKGVARDYQEGVKWRKKHTEYLREEYKKKRDRETATQLFDGLWDLGDAWYALRKLDDAENACQEMISLAKEYKLRRNLSACYNKLGDIAIAQGKTEKALEYYEKGLEVSLALSEETGTTGSRRELSLSYNKLGDIAIAQGKIEKAREYYEKLFEISFALFEETGTIEARQDLIVSYGRLGDIANTQKKLEKAWEYYEKCLELSLALTEETGTIEARRYLTVSYGKVGNIALAQRKYGEALGNYEKELEISLALSEETGTIESRRDLAVSYGKLGTIALAQRKYEEAREYYEKLLELSLALAEETGTIESRQDLSRSYASLGDIAIAQRKYEEAWEYYEKCLEIHLALIEKTGTIESRRALSVSYGKLGTIALAQRKYEEARDYFEKFKEISFSLSEETGTIESRRDLSVCYNLLGDIASEQGNLEEALGYYEKGLEIRLALSEEAKTIESRRDLVVSYERLGDTACVQGKQEEEREYYEKMHELCLALAEETGTIESWQELQLSSLKLGIVLLKGGRNRERAKEMFEEAVKIGDMKEYPALRELADRAEEILEEYF